MPEDAVMSAADVHEKTIVSRKDDRPHRVERVQRLIYRPADYHDYDLCVYARRRRRRRRDPTGRFTLGGTSFRSQISPTAIKFYSAP